MAKQLGESGDFVLINGSDAIERKLLNLFENAQDSVCVMIPWQRMHQWIDNHYDTFMKTLKRKVFIRVITDHPNNPTVSKRTLMLLKIIPI